MGKERKGDAKHLFKQGKIKNTVPETICADTPWSQIRFGETDID